VPYDATKPVHTFWDLGWADNTSIWFAQVVGFEYRVIDHLSGSQKPLNAYLGELQAKGYIYGTDWLPHDAKAKQLGTGRSVEEMMRAAGRTVRIVPQLSVEDGINAARTVFANCWFDQERCADGLQSLRHYRYEMDERAGTLKRVPLHDFASHDADAFRYLCVALKNPVVPPPRPVREPWEYAHPNPPGTDWMRM
jgi:phage terminase large subunit